MKEPRSSSHWRSSVNTSNPTQLRVAVLLSGGGRTLQNLIDRAGRGQLPIEIVGVISSRADAGGVERARHAGIPTQVISRESTAPEPFDQQVTQALDHVRPDLVCMAGFLSKWTIPPTYEHRVMNIHPALLPKFGGKGFYGLRVHEAVLAARETRSGCTVHFANNQYDAGPIILQRTVEVLPQDTPDSLASRVFDAECIVYPEAIRLFSENRLRVEGDRVRLIGPNEWGSC